MVGISRIGRNKHMYIHLMSNQPFCFKSVSKKEDPTALLALLDVPCFYSTIQVAVKDILKFTVDSVKSVDT